MPVEIRALTFDAERDMGAVAIPVEMDATY